VARRLAHYGVALLTVAVATVLMRRLDPTGSYTPFLLYFGAVAVTAWFGGLGPGLLATATSALVANYLFLSPTHSLVPQSTDQVVRLGVFTLQCALISFLSESLLRAERRASEMLAERTRSEARFRRVVESNVIGMLFWRDTGEITEANGAFLAMVGHEHDGQAAKLDWRSLVAPDYLPRHGEALDEIRARGISRPFASELLRRDGSRLPILCGGASLSRPHDGEGVTWVVDITAQKGLEAELRDSAAVIDTVNRVGRRISAELDLERLVQEVTDAATALSGARFGAFFYNRVDADGEAYMLYTISGVPREAFSKFPMPRNSAVFAATFAGTGLLRLDDVTKDVRYGQNPPHHGMPAGHLPVVSYLAVPVISRSGDVLGGLFFGHPEAGMFKERHERLVVGLAAQAAVALDNARLFEAAERARAEAVAASRAKDEFLSVVSHELRTPLSSMLNWLKVLQRGGGVGTDRFDRALASMERSTRIQAKLIDDLLDVSRIVGGRMQIEHRPVKLAAPVRAAFDTMAPTAEAKGVRLEAEIDGALTVAGDVDRLQQVAWNLLSNAVKFTPAGGVVRLSLARVNGNAEIVVRDTGRGIAADFLPHIFERFRQADAAATRAQSGLGLGLAIVRHLVDLHGGTVVVESPGEGQGATFRIDLPLMGEAAAAQEEHRDKAS
jgi:PAS domain S-box-containing protein